MRTRGAVGATIAVPMLALGTLARLTGHPLALPQTVLDELMGHYERTITEAHATVERIEQRQQADKPEKYGQADKLAAARDVLLDLIPWWIGRAEFYRGDNSKLPLIASACRREEDRLRKVFHIVPKPACAAPRSDIDVLLDAETAGRVSA